MLKAISIDFICSEPCLSALRARLDAIKEYSALPGLLKRSDIDDADASWYVGYYDSRIVTGEYFSGVVIAAGGVRFVLPQANFAHELNGKELVYVEGKFVVQPRS